MFAPSARWYDAVYRFRDAEKQVPGLVKAIRDRNPEAKTLLDVACGTGEHLKWLVHDFDAAGLDLSPELLEIAREKLPKVELIEADMLSFKLNRRFDAITCLFGSVAYTETPDKLEAAIANMAEHLEAGGVLLVEPWVAKDNFKPGYVSAIFVDEPDLKLARIARTRREGDLALLSLDYLISDAGEIHRLEEEHRLGLFSREDYEQAFRSSGLEATYDEQGPMGRGLWTAGKP